MMSLPKDKQSIMETHHKLLKDFLEIAVIKNLLNTDLLDFTDEHGFLGKNPFFSVKSV